MKANVSIKTWRGEFFENIVFIPNSIFNGNHIQLASIRSPTGSHILHIGKPIRSLEDPRPPMHRIGHCTSRPKNENMVLYGNIYIISSLARSYLPCFTANTNETPLWCLANSQSLTCWPLASGDSLLANWSRLFNAHFSRWSWDDIYLKWLITFLPSSL